MSRDGMDRRNHVRDAENQTPEPSEEKEFAQFEPYALLILYAIGTLIVLLCGLRQRLHQLPRALAAYYDEGHRHVQRCRPRAVPA